MQAALQGRREKQRASNAKAARRRPRDSIGDRIQSAEATFGKRVEVAEPHATYTVGPVAQ